jgi:hypothetical protein
VGGGVGGARTERGGGGRGAGEVPPIHT